jgi:hypothetical protein
MKSAEGGVFDTTRIFHAASPAFMRPPFSPTRGSGVGALIAVMPDGDGAAPAGPDAELLHPAAAISAANSSFE